MSKTVSRRKVSRRKACRRSMSRSKTSRLHQQKESKQDKFNRRCPTTVKPTPSFVTERAGLTLYKAPQRNASYPNSYQGQIKL
jgi:hypothetical protein